MVLLFACQKDCPGPEVPNCNPTEFDFQTVLGPMRDTFPPISQPFDNVATNEGVQLGRFLFYDSLLSASEGTACANCHQVSEYFSDGLVQQPNDAGGTPRFATMSLINLVYKSRYFWNGRVSSVEATVEDAILEEHSIDWAKSIDSLSADTMYQRMFAEAFCSTAITRDFIVKALAQFLRTIISNQSPYDLGTMTPEAEEGMLLWFDNDGADCWHCHNVALFGSNQPENNGMDSIPNEGLFEISGDSLDFGKFLTPTLRNIEFTAPYMHDGRFQTLEEVVDHYSEGVIATPWTSSNMELAQQGGVQLTPIEKQRVIAFMKSLTDTAFINRELYSNPFD